MIKLLLSACGFIFFMLNTNIINAQCTNPTPTGDTPQIFCAAEGRQVSDLVANGGLIRWYALPSGGVPLDVSELLVNSTYYADDTISGGCSVNRLAVQVIVNGFQPGNVNVQVSVCENDNPTIENLSATGQNIEWFSSQTGGSALPISTPLVDLGVYWVQQTVNGCTSLRRSTLVNFIDALAPVFTEESLIQEFCESDMPMVSDLEEGGMDIIWYASAAETVPLDMDVFLVDGEDYWAASVVLSCESVTRTPITVVLDQNPDAGENASIDICVATLAQEPINLYDFLSGSAADIGGQWTGPSTLSNGDLGTYTFQVNTPGTYTYTVNGDLGICDPSSATVTITESDSPPPSTINTTQEFCETDTPTVTNLQATGTAITWYDSLTSTSPLAPETLLIDGAVYYATQTTTATNCESSERLEVTVQINVTAAPTTNSATQTFCDIDNATVADLDADGTSINWYDSLVSTTPLDVTTLLIDGSIYYATQTTTSTGCESLQRLEITVVINTTTAPTTNNATQVFCEIDNPTVANLQATGTAINWYDSLTSTTPLDPTTLLIDGSIYYATQTTTDTNCESTDRLEVTVQINTIAAPSTDNTIQEFCETDNATVADLQATGTGIIWYDSLLSTTPLDASTLLIDGAVYYATQTDAASTCESEERLEVTVLISPTPEAPTTDNATQEFCENDNATVADLQVNGTLINWYDSIGSTTPLDETTLLINGSIYYASQTTIGANCESTSRLEVTVLINPTPAAPTTDNTTQEFCETDNATLLDLQVNETSINWYDSIASTTPLDPATLLIDGMVYFATQTNATSNCESSERLEVLVFLSFVSIPELIDDGDQFCLLDEPTLSDLSMNIIKETGTTIQWYDDFLPDGDLLNEFELLASNQTYYAIAVDDNGCQSEALIVTVSLDNCDAEDLILYDGFSPNGDGTNDTFNIENIDFLFPNYEVNYYNRWGNLMYTTNINKPEWNGRLNGTGEAVPVGVYFFVIDFNDNSKTQRQGRLYLSR